MAAQDDVREQQMIDRFNLVKREETGRSGVDAELTLPKAAWVPKRFRGRTIEFELKSATGGKASFSTGRDIGLGHIARWRQLHWLFGVYKDGKPQFFMYGSPAAMQPWFDALEAYIKPDLDLAKCAPQLITDDTLTSILGPAEVFTREDAKRVMKAQYKAAQYDAAADLKGGLYSRRAMLKLLRLRAQYVILRGSTLNNPSMGSTHFKDFERITDEPAARLRRLVVKALDEAEPE